MNNSSNDIIGQNNLCNNPFYIGNNNFYDKSINYNPYGLYNTLNNNSNFDFNNSMKTVNGTINASARVQIDSTTQGFLPPRMTTAQKTGIVSPATGLVVFDTDLGKLCVFAVTWQTITSV